MFEPKPRKRIVAVTACESLESRCLLSAAMRGGMEVAAEVRAERHHEKKAPVVLPHLDGQFFMITNTDHGRFTGILTITQNGKHLKGTLANPGQPPGKFTATIVIVKNHGRAAASDQVKLKGKVVDKFVESGPEKFESDPFSAFAWPEDDVPSNSRIDFDWIDRLDEIIDSPNGLPDFELHPVPK